uniref:Putative ovule protein n=1 Tax=Solanum chacoense TaxID=4108 RepID=A0A0V0GVD3_SOLCH
MCSDIFFEIYDDKNILRNRDASNSVVQISTFMDILSFMVNIKIMVELSVFSLDIVISIFIYLLKKIVISIFISMSSKFT